MSIKTRETKAFTKVFRKQTSFNRTTTLHAVTLNELSSLKLLNTTRMSHKKGINLEQVNAGMSLDSI